MSIECGECEQDLRGGHADECSRQAPAQRAVNAIIADLLDRRGLKQAWRSIDEDIQEEIADRWVDIVASATKATP